MTATVLVCENGWQPSVWVAPLIVAGGNPRRPHHIEHAGGETEQQEHNKPPRRDAEPAVEPPADAGADENAGDQLGREPDPTRHARTNGFRRWAFRLRHTARPVAAELITETPQSRGKSSLVLGLVAWFVV